MYMPEWKKALILIVGLLEILIFGGTILGWTSLKLMLKNEGIYEYKCQLKTPINSSNETQERLQRALIPSNSNLILTTPPPTNTNFSLKINFTFINNNDEGNRFKSVQGMPLRSTVVIPFESPNTFNQTFIYTLLRDPQITLKSNLSEAQIDLHSGTDSKSKNISTLEEFIHLYMEENIDPLFQSSDNGCQEQEVILNFAFSIGSFCMGAAAFIWGFLLEKWGLRVVRLIINSMITSGAFLLCFTSKGHDWLIFPAILTMSLGGVPIRIANMQFSNLYPAKRSTIISVYSGAFSASSIIYVILQYNYAHNGISFFWVNFILVLFSLLMIPFTLFILPPDKIRDGGEILEDHKMVDQDKFAQPQPTLFSRRSTVFAISQITLQNYKPVSSPKLNRKNGFVNEAFDSDEPYLSIDSRQLTTTKATTPVSPPLGISLNSFAYNLHQLWFSWMITYMLMYVGSMNLWTERVTYNKDHQLAFVNLYGLFQVLALVISPLAGLLMDWQLGKAESVDDPLEKRLIRTQSGFWPLFITTITLLLCVFCHFFDTKEFIYISIVFITIYRAFLLAVGSAFLRIRFHRDHFNRLLGIMSSVSAVISLLQIPLFKWESSSESNVLYVNIFNMVVAVLVMSNPMYLLITPLQRYFLRKEEKRFQEYAQ